MGRRAKSSKGKTGRKRSPAQEPPKNEGAWVGDLEKRLAESLEREKATGEILREKDRALAEALEQQTATSEILRVISMSPTDVQPVFDAIASRGARLCDADFCIVFRFDGTMITVAAHDGRSPGTLDVIRAAYPAPPGRRSISARTIFERRVVSIADAQDPSAHPPGFEGQADRARAVGYRSILAVPMLRDHAAIGAINVARLEVRPFNDREIALLQTFADQAVIAIENVRLFNETKEALEQQTATAEILRVISTSPTDLEPVLNTVVTSAARFCGAYDAVLFQQEEGRMRPVAHHGQIPELGRPRQITPGTVRGRTFLERRPIHVADLQAETEEFPEGSADARRLGHRTILSVPLLREGAAVGVITLRRTEVDPFTDKQIALLQTFADQAVIAIENVRLFTELREKNAALTQAHAQVIEALDQQTATSEVLKVISRSTFDLEPVLQTLIENAVRLCHAWQGVIYKSDGDLQRLAAAYNTSPEYRTFVEQNPLGRDRGTVVGRAMLEGRPIHIHDVLEDPGYTYAGQTIGNYRTILGVPMMREGVSIGVFSVGRAEVLPFTDKQIELVTMFADQGAIAIENVRLFKELEASNLEIAEKSRRLEAASQHKSEFLANMSHELRTPLNAIIGFSEVLNERMFGELNDKQAEYLKDIYASGQHLLSLINDILDLSKIEAGRMELEAADFDLPSAIDNALTLVRERATRRGITLGRTMDDRLGVLRGDERKVKQVLLNLLSNALKFTPEGGRIDVRAAMNHGMAEIAVADTGVGIAPEDQEAIFEEFRQVGTADKKVEGTGLGLALSRKFIELHGGRIWVSSELGKGSTFTFRLPMRHGE